MPLMDRPPLAGRNAEKEQALIQAESIGDLFVQNDHRECQCQLLQVGADMSGECSDFSMVALFSGYNCGLGKHQHFLVSYRPCPPSPTVHTFLLVRDLNPSPLFKTKTNLQKILSEIFCFLLITDAEFSTVGITSKNEIFVSLLVTNSTRYRDTNTRLEKKKSYIH